MEASYPVIGKILPALPACLRIRRRVSLSMVMLMDLSTRGCLEPVKLAGSDIVTFRALAIIQTSSWPLDVVSCIVVMG